MRYRRLAFIFGDVFISLLGGEKSFGHTDDFFVDRVVNKKPTRINFENGTNFWFIQIELSGLSS